MGVSVRNIPKIRRAAKSQQKEMEGRHDVLGGGDGKKVGIIKSSLIALKKAITTNLLHSQYQHCFQQTVKR